MIRYTDSLAGITPEMLRGFFVGWPNPPSPETHLRLLENASFVWLALDTESGKAVGFVNAISDRVLSAYIPLVEVLPEYQFRGIGAELMSRMLTTLREHYMIDLTCDRSRIPGYRSVGMTPHHAMMVRHFDRQSGLPRSR